MKSFFTLTGIGMVLGIFMSCSSVREDADFRVVPLPEEITQAEGEPFILKKGVKILYPQDNALMKRNAEFLAEYLNTATGKDFHVKTGTEGKNAIILALGLESDNDEAYRLTVNNRNVTITAPTEQGVFYGIQTLRKALPIAQGADIVLPAVEINNQPRFGYRGAMLDIGRHFMTVDEVKTYIDIMALHGMNRFHWHLTEDQGWRLEIKKYPKLVSVGSRREQTVIGHNSGEYDGTPYEGYITQEQAKEVVQYAAERYITVIPEIDMPGHMQSVLAAYPELGCTGGPYEVKKEWGISPEVLCAGNDSTYTFLEDILEELIGIFPSEYIHIGGDECPRVRWAECPKCQAKAKELGLKDTEKFKKEALLQSYITRHVEKFLNERGRQIIGWDELLEGELSPNATVMSWRSVEGGVTAAKMGHGAIMTPTQYLYFDYYQSKDREKEPDAIGGYVPVEKVYGFEPVSENLAPEERKYILGAQANLWTEYIPSFDIVQYMVLPRFAALSEVQWLSPEKKNYEDFIQRLQRLAKWYDAEGYNYAKHVISQED